MPWTRYAVVIDVIGLTREIPMELNLLEIMKSRTMVLGGFWEGDGLDEPATLHASVWGALGGTRRVGSKPWTAERTSLFCDLSLRIGGEGTGVRTNCIVPEKAHDMSQACALERACWSLGPQMPCGSWAQARSPTPHAGNFGLYIWGQEKEDTSSCGLCAKLTPYRLASLSPQWQRLWLCLPFFHFCTRSQPHQRDKGNL